MDKIKPRTLSGFMELPPDKHARSSACSIVLVVINP